MTDGSRRQRLTAALDWVAAMLLVVAVAIHLTGGLYLRLGDVRVSARRDERALLLAAAVVAIRLFLNRQRGPLGIPVRVWRERFRSLFSTSDDPALYVSSGLWRRALLVTLVLCAVGAMLMWEQVRQMYAVPDLGDPLLSIWRISWVWHQLRADPSHLFDGNIFHPDPLTLTYSDSTLLPAITAVPLLAAGVHPVVVYNILLLSAFVLSGVAIYVLVERLTGSPPGAFVSAVLFAFYPFRFEHYPHLELQMTHWMPLVLLALHKFVETARRRYAIAAAVTWAAQLYSSMYYALFLGVYATAIAAVYIIVRRRAVRPLIRGAVTGMIVAALLALPLIRAYSAPAAYKAPRDVGTVALFSAKPADYLRVHARSALHSGRMPPEERPECALFPGVVPLALTAVSLVRPVSLVAATYAAGFGVAFEMSLGFHGFVYPWLYDWLPPFRRIRVPARFSILAGLSLAVLAGIGTRRLLRRFGSTNYRRWVTLCVIAAAAIVEVRPTLRLQPVWKQPPSIYGSIADTPGVVLAEYPLPREVGGFADNTPFMYFSLWHRRPMLNGYSGLIPPSFETFVLEAGEFPAPHTIEFLRRRGVSHVTVNCALFRTPCAPVIEGIEQSGAFRRVVEAMWERQPVYLYELIR